MIYVVSKPFRWKWLSVAVLILAVFIMWLLRNISPPTTSSALDSKPTIKNLLELKIIIEVASKCDTFGYLLNLDSPTVKNEWDVPGKDVVSKCQNIMLWWLDGKEQKERKANQ